MAMKVMELNHQKSVCDGNVWKDLQNGLIRNVTFDLSRQDDQVSIIFGIETGGSSEFTAHCSMKWAVFMLSLREFAENRKGKPSPRDLKIDNWN
jgi:hypothetical protein